MDNELITEKELCFIEQWYTPKALLEFLFHNWDNLNAFHNHRYGNLRLYQQTLVSDEAIIDFEATARMNDLDEQETFDCRKRVGDIYCFGARKFGKTMVVETMDLILQMLTHGADKVAFASVDLIHLKQVLDPVKNCFEGHKICKLWKDRITGAPDYHFVLKNDWIMNSVNFNIGSKNPGQQWYGKHVFRVYIEEASLETEEVFAKRHDALSELGAIFRVSGMTNFTVHSPAGKTFYNQALKHWVVNLPQYVNPTYNLKREQEAEEFYGGKSSIGFRIYVDGEIVEDGISVFDMSRVREFSIVEKKKLSLMEVDKPNFKFFKQLLIVDRPAGQGRIFLDADIGLNTTEINVIWESAKNYEYLYNITLFNLTDDEQSTIFKHLISLLNANVIALDCGDGMGRAIYNELEKTIPKTNLVWYDGKEKISIGFETDIDGKVIYKDGAPLPKYERMAEWSVKRLKDLLYSGDMIIPEDFKFISQFGQVISTTSGDKILYKCTSPQGDHLFDSFKVFAIAEWLKCDANKTPDVNSNWGIGVV
jgi:hypothetical protein